jgi:NAD-dependent deacetylase
LAIAKLEQKLQERLFLCTQNVDNLHEQAGSINVVHMHELFKSRCDTCSLEPFEDTSAYEAPVQIPLCECGGQIRPHICWFGEIPFQLDRIHEALNNCTVFMAVGTSGVVEPAASFVTLARRCAKTIYVGPEEPANRNSLTEVWLGTAAEMLPKLLE